MPIVSTDILFFLSGGSTNTDPNACLGGVQSTTQIVDNTLHNLFNLVTGAEALSGYIDYRGIYIKNNNGSLTLNTPIAVWLAQNTSDNEIYIGLDPNGVNVTMETIANINTAPAGVTFTQPASFGAGLSVAQIPSGQSFGLWVKRSVPAATVANNAATFQIEIQGDTAA